jgi:hypothetical protein
MSTKEKSALASIFEEDFHIPVGVTLGVGGDHDEGLPVEVGTLVAEQVMHDFAGADSEATLVVVQVHVEGGVEQRVEPAAQVVAGALFATDGAAPSLNDVDAGFDEGSKQSQDVFGLVLEVGVDDADVLSASDGDAGFPCGGDTAVSGMEASDDLVGVFFHLLFDDAAGAIGAAVVDEDELALELSSFQDAEDALDEGGDVELLVEAGSDDGEGEGVGIGGCIHGLVIGSKELRKTLRLAGVAQPAWLAHPGILIERIRGGAGGAREAL